MNEINTLKVLISVFYYVVLVGSIGITLFLLFGMFFIDGGSFTLDRDAFIVPGGKLGRDIEWRELLILLSSFTIMLFFVKSIYHLRNATLKIVNGEVYSEQVTRQLRLTGIFMIGYVVLKVFLYFIKEIIYQQQFTIGLDFTGYNSTFFLIILGLFFMLVARVIDNGRALKIENDLTI